MNPTIQPYLTGDYLFHGSTHPALTRLLPNAPHDAGDDPRNKEVAVYATAELAEAIIFALIGGFCGTFEVTRSPQGETLARFPQRFAEQLSRNTGSLYVLPKSDLAVQDPWQYKSYTPVTPVTEISVTLQDYLDAGGKLEFTGAGTGSTT